MDHGFEALIRFAGAHGNALELFEFTEEVFDEMAPLVHFGVNIDWVCPARMLGYDDLGAPGVQIVDYPIGVKGLVCKERAELQALNQRGYPNGVEAMARKQDETHQTAKGIGQSEDFRRHPTL